MKHILILILFFPLTQIFAQDEIVKTKVSDGKILVKWFPEELIDPDGFNVYRSVNGSDFIKVNDAPVIIDLSTIEDESDNELKQYKRMAQRYAEGDQGEPMLKFYILVKSMTSDEFAKFIGIRYDDQDVESGNDYVYRIERLRNKEILGTSEPENIDSESKVDPPKDVKLVFQSGSRNTFTWLPETDRYFAVNAYRKGDGENEYTKLNNTPIIPSQAPDELGIIRYPDYFFEDTLITKASYYYHFTAIDAFGDEGLKTEDLYVKSLDDKAPEAVSKLELSNTETEITLNWKASSSNDVAGYNIYRSFNGDTVFLHRNTSLHLNTSYVDPIDRPGTYMYHVGAVDEAGNEALSELEYIIVSDLTPPPSPRNLNVLAEAGKVSLSWESEKTGDFWGYKLMRSDVENPRKEDFQLIIPEPMQANQFENILAGESELALYYAVASLDTFNNESEWLISDKVMTPDTVAPKAPVIYSANAEEESVTIEWLPSPDLDVTAYKVYRCEKEDMDWVSLGDEWIDAGSLTFTDKNPLPGQFLCYKVVAKDDADNISNGSNVYTIKSKTSISNNEQSIDLLQPKFRKNRKIIELEWTQKTNGPYSGFMIFKAENDGKFSPASPFLKVSSFEDSNYKENTNYRYQIKAFSEDGTVAISNIETITIK